MSNGYAEWRESEVKRVGSACVRQAEERVDAARREPLETVRDRDTGAVSSVKRSVAGVLKAKRKVETPRKYYVVPDLSHLKRDK